MIGECLRPSEAQPAQAEDIAVPRYCRLRCHGKGRRGFRPQHVMHRSSLGGRAR